MAKEAKDIKTNAMRILDSERVAYRIHTYTCEAFHDGLSIARMLGQDPDISYKTLVAKGKSGDYFVFVIPVAEELDLKAAARAAGEKSVQMLPLARLTEVTGYIRGACSPIGMKKSLPTFVEETAQLFDVITFSGGKRGLQLVCAPDELLRITGGAYAALTVS